MDQGAYSRLSAKIQGKVEAQKRRNQAVLILSETLKNEVVERLEMPRERAMVRIDNMDEMGESQNNYSGEIAKYKFVITIDFTDGSKVISKQDLDIVVKAKGNDLELSCATKSQSVRYLPQIDNAAIKGFAIKLENLLNDRIDEL